MLIPLAVLRTTVTVEPSLGNTGDGETFGAPVPVLGSLKRFVRVVRTPDGDVKKAEATLLVRPGEPVEIGDRVSEGADVWKVDKVMPALVGGREHHWEVLLT